MAMANEDEMDRVGESDGESEVDRVGESDGESEVDRVGESDGESDEQEIEMKPIRCPEARIVYFHLLREQLFKEATVLCALTGAQLAIVVFSPVAVRKPYPFGHPSVDAVIERYYDPSPSAIATAAAPASEYDFDSERERLCKAIAAEARRREELDAAARAAGVWTSDDALRWGIGMPDLVATLAALERVQAEIAERAREMFAEEAMVQPYAAATGASDAFNYDLGDGSLTADGGANSRQQGGMDTQTMLLGGNVVNHAAHAPPPAFPPVTMLHPDLLPPAPPTQVLPFNYGSEHNHIAGNAEGYTEQRQLTTSFGSNGRCIIL